MCRPSSVRGFGTTVKNKAQADHPTGHMIPSTFVADERKALHGKTTVSLGNATRQLGERHRLIVWDGGISRSWPLPTAGEVTVGRTEPADIFVDSPAVSRRHARIQVGPPVRLEDLHSRNFTRVNGERLSGERDLAYGDVITFGDVIAVFDELPTETKAQVEDEPRPEGLELQLGDRTAFVADPVMLHVYTQVQRLAESPLSVLIVGETGTGKELVAYALHGGSKRRGSPFLSINCAALPEGLAESELFGHERGAFSGAVRERAGLFESANGGTVFLDEIGDLSLSIQPKLLRVLENQRVTRVGSVRERPIDVRMVAATHRDLAFEVSKGRFRQDLFYRLGAAMVQLPPLRARPREVPLLAGRFLSQARLDLGRPPLTISESAMSRLASHTWPGNVRELKNLMEYIAALVDGSVTDSDVAAAFASQAWPRKLSSAPPLEVKAAEEQPPRSYRDEKDEFELKKIETALAASGGNKSRAARLLGMPLRTFTWKLKRLGSKDK
jgi:transcriptional regulator with GAF, ATPase, and Fis domain